VKDLGMGHFKRPAAVAIRPAVIFRALTIVKVGRARTGAQLQGNEANFVYHFIRMMTPR